MLAVNGRVFHVSISQSHDVSPVLHLGVLVYDYRRIHERP